MANPAELFKDLMKMIGAGEEAAPGVGKLVKEAKGAAQLGGKAADVVSGQPSGDANFVLTGQGQPPKPPEATGVAAFDQEAGKGKPAFGEFKGGESVDDVFAALKKLKPAKPPPGMQVIQDALESYKAYPPKLSGQGQFGGASSPATSEFDELFAKIEKGVTGGMGAEKPPSLAPKSAAEMSPQMKQSILGWQPPTKPATMWPDVLPEAERQAARKEGNYVTEAFRGKFVEPGKGVSGTPKGDILYSTASTKLADMYSSHLSQHPGDAPKAGAYHEGATVQPVWINTKNYAVFDAKGKNRPELGSTKSGWLADLQKQGKPGVIIKNVYDEPSLGKTLGPQTIFITFPKGKSTVKSKFAAKFDPTSKDMSRGIAAIGIGMGAAGVGMAMAPQDAEASEPGPAFKKMMELWHGSGVKDIEKFDWAKHRGSGEGSMYFGPGLYGAEARPVAEKTRQAAEARRGEPGSGQTYQLGVEAHPDDFIDWHKPISANETMAKRLANLGITGDITGEEAYRQLERRMGDDPIKIAKAMQDNGIQGVSYLDAHSRAPGAQTQTRNYTVLDPDKVKILGKYGLAGLLGAGAAGAGIGEAKAGESPDLDFVLGKPSREMSPDLKQVLVGQTKEPTVMESLKEFPKQVGRDIKDIFKEGIEEGEKGFKHFWHQFDRENILKYNEYRKDHDHWESLGDLEKAVVPEPRPPTDASGHPLSGGQAWMDFLHGTFGELQAVGAIPLGLTRAGAGRPLEEATGGKVPKEVTEFVAGLALGKIGIFSTKPLTTAAKLVYETVGENLNKVFNPELLGKGERAETLLRGALGMAARDTEKTRAAFDQYWNAVEAMQTPEKVGLTAYIEGRMGGAKLGDPALQPVANAFRDAMELRRTKLANLPSTHQMSFVEDYFPHMWKDPNQANKFLSAWYGGKMGTGKALKKRTIPTISDGLAAGLEPISYNPLEIGMQYVQNMDRFIAHNAVIDVGRAVKDVKYFRNQGLHENPFNRVAEKQGLVPLAGRLATRRTKYGDMVAFAPPDWARVYNNAIGSGFHGVQGPYKEMIGNAYDRTLHASNSVTAMELGLSGFHMATMIHEGFVSDLATAVSKAVGGAQALKAGQAKEAGRLLAGSAFDVLKAPTGLVRKPFIGKKGQDIYLGRSPGTAHNRELIDLMEKAGGRAVGMTHTNEYKYTAAHSYFNSFKTYSDLISKHAYTALAKSFKADYAAGKVLPAPMAFLARQVGRTLATVSDPLFKYYIPKMKTGAFMENMSEWLKANPGVSQEEKVKMAKRIWDSVDNRFGEMVQDNIFWPKMLKQAAMVGMRSYSWNLGTVREIGGGAKSVIASKGKSIGIRGMEYDPKAGYVIALPMAVAIVNGVYQYMMTGKGPESVADLMHGRTGGKVPGLGGRGQVEERADLPGYQKDVFGWATDWQQEAINKMSALPSAAWEVMANRDWRNDPIVNPEANLPSWVADYFNYFTNKFLPITVKQEMRGGKKGSEIGPAQSRLGIRPSGARWTDPEGYAAFKKYQGQAIEKKRLKEKAREKKVYGGTE